MVTRLAWEIYVKPRSVRPIRRGRSPKSVPAHVPSSDVAGHLTAGVADPI